MVTAVKKGEKKTEKKAKAVKQISCARLFHLRHTLHVLQQELESQKFCMSLSQLRHFQDKLFQLRRLLIRCQSLREYVF